MSQAPPPMPPPMPLNYASPGTAPPKRFGKGLFGWILFIGLAVMLFVIMTQKNSQTSSVSLSEVYDQLAAGNIVRITIDGDMVRGDFRQPITVNGPNRVFSFRSELPQGTNANWAFTQWLLDKKQGADVRVENSGTPLSGILAPIVPWLVLILFFWFFVLRHLRNNAQTPQKPMPVVIVNPETAL